MREFESPQLTVAQVKRWVQLAWRADGWTQLWGRVGPFGVHSGWYLATLVVWARDQSGGGSPESGRFSRGKVSQTLSSRLFVVHVGLEFQSASELWFDIVFSGWLVSCGALSLGWRRET